MAGMVVQAGLLAGTPAAFPGDDLKAATANRRTTMGCITPWALIEFASSSRVGVHVPTWLVFAPLDQVQRQVLQLALVGLHRLFFKRCDIGRRSTVHPVHVLDLVFWSP
jgi:hypothetical protein